MFAMFTYLLTRWLADAQHKGRNLTEARHRSYGWVAVGKAGAQVRHRLGTESWTYTSVVRPLLQQWYKLLGNTPLLASCLYPCCCAPVRHHGTLYRRPYEEMRFVTTAVRFPCRALVNIVVLKPEVYWECRDTGNEKG